MSLRRLLARLRSLWNRAQIDEDLAEEIDAHIEMEQEEQVVAGRTPDGARAEALRAFGNVTLSREDARAAWKFQWIETLWQDARHAARTLRRNLGFTAVAVATLALGIGATTSIFSVVDTILLRPLPYKDSQKLIAVYSSYARFQGMKIAVSMRDWNEMRAGTRSFGQPTFFFQNYMDLAGAVEPEKVWTCQVSPGFFDLLGQRPALGRFFLPEEENPGQGRGQAAVITWKFWQANFGGDPGVLQKTLALDGKPYTIVGVSARGFDLPGASGKYSTQIWLPIQQLTEGAMNAHFTGTLPGGVLARLAPSFSVHDANLELQSLSELLTREYPENDKEWSLSAMSAQDDVVGDQRTPLLVLLGAVGLLLLIACANVASLVLSRGLKRESEFAVRTALGASRSRLVRQLVTESFVLALLGGTLGVLLAIGGVVAFRSFAPPNLPRLEEVRPDFAVLWMAMGIVLFAAAMSGLAPVLQFGRPDVMTAVKQGGGRSTVRSGLRGVVVVVEVGLALALTIGSVLLIQSLSNLTNQPTGMRIDHVLTMSLQLPQSRYPDRKHGEAFVREVLENIRGLPGVESAAAADILVLGGGGNFASHVRVEGNPNTAQGVGNIALSDVTPDFFRLLGISPLEGRTFTLQDAAGAPGVAMINRKMADMLWGKRDPVGTRVSFDSDAKGHPIWLTVVGVVADTKDSSLQAPPKPELYAPLLQQTVFPDVALLVRTSASAAAILPAVKQQIWKVDKEEPINDVQTLEELVSQDVAGPRFRTGLLGVFAVLGLVLAAVGIYGVVSYAVAERTREIGIRMALGAQNSSVIALVLRYGMTLVGTGILLGAALALGLSRLMAGVLFGVGPLDGVAFVASSLLLASIGFAACYVPARRAMRVDPLIALRYE